MAYIGYSDPDSWDPVLSFLQNPEPNDYCLECAARLEEEVLFDRMALDECNLSKTQGFYRPETCDTRRIEEVEQAPALLQWNPMFPELCITTGAEKTTSPPGKLLKLTEVEMVQYLRRRKYQIPIYDHIPVPITINDVDVYEVHPKDLIAGASNPYFFCTTKYTTLKRPTRLRITRNGCRWKQQRRMFPIRENGVVVAYKTYLSYVPLKSAQGTHEELLRLENAEQPTPSAEVSKKGRKNCSAWTMEEIGLAENVRSERFVLRSGGMPQAFLVMCRIVSRNSASVLKARKAVTKKKTAVTKEKAPPSPAWTAMPVTKKSTSSSWTVLPLTKKKPPPSPWTAMHAPSTETLWEPLPFTPEVHGFEALEDQFQKSITTSSNNSTNTKAQLKLEGDHI